MGGRRKMTNSQAIPVKKIRLEIDPSASVSNKDNESSVATTSSKGIKQEEEVNKEHKDTNSSSNQEPLNAAKEEDTYPYPNRTPEEFLRKQLKLSHPTGWVKETASKRGWHVQEKEGMSGLPNNRDFQLTLTVKELVTVGLAIKFGEVFKLLSPQLGTDKEELYSQIMKLIKPS